MDSQAKYQDEIEFTDASAERILSNLPDDLDLSNMQPFEDLCNGIDYLRTAPGFFGDLSGKKVLEMGCGNGWISLRFAKSGARVWACDISPKTIQLAKHLAETAHLDVAFETMICEEMTYEDNFFDFVFMHMALHHCDIVATAEQIHRVLKPGGKAILIEDYAYHPIMRLYRALTPNKHTENETPLTVEDTLAIASDFSSHTIEYSGLLNIFETSENKIVSPFKLALRRTDDFLYRHFGFIQRYSRIVIIKAIKQG